MSSLLKKQMTFSRNVGHLLMWAAEQGYGVTLGEAWRTPEQAALNAKNGKGISKSLHISRLALDINLFRNGELCKEVNDYKPLGDYWKSLDALNRWGGDFKSRDAVHFSMEHEGRQ